MTLRAWIAVGACCALACSGDDGERSASKPPPPAAVAPALQPTAAASTPEPAPAKPASRALALRAAASAQALSAALGAPVPGVGRRLRNDAKEPLALDVAGGARLIVEPASELWLMELAPSLLSLSGRLQVERLPEASRPDQPSLRIATLGGALGITGPAVLRLRTALAAAKASEPLPRALTQLTLLQGSATWLHATDDQALAHERLVVGERWPELPSLQLLAAKSAADADRRAAQAFRTARPWSPGSDPDARVEALLSELAALRDQGQGLLAPATLRRARSTAPDGGLQPDELLPARAYQKQLVQHTQRKLALQQLLLLAAEQSLLTQLLRCAAQPAGTSACPALARWSERFAERLRAAL